MQPSTAMMPNQNSDEDEETTLLLGTTILPTPPTTTTDHRSLKWYMVASFAGMMLLVMAGGTVLRRDGEIAAAEGLVLSTTNSPSYPYCESNKKRGCECAKQQFTCDPFGPNACGSIYMSPDEAKVNVPWEVAKDAYQATSALVAGIGGDPLALFALPFKLVNNGKNPHDYEVDDVFVDEMKTNVQNYVAQAVSQAQMESLYDGIKGNTAAFQHIVLSYADFLCDDTNEELKNQSKTLILAQISYMINQYPSYESKNPMTDPLTTYPTGSKTGANGWGIYYSVFVDQLLIAFLQDIAVTGKDHLADSITSQQEIVKYGWKGMRHAEELIDAYVAQRESKITGPTSQYDTNLHLDDYKVEDDWVYYPKSGNSQTCSWKELNPYTSSSTKPSSTGGYLYISSCDQPTVDFVTASSIHCKEGRRQFVTGSIINSWNTWLIEPAKQWAKLVDLICESGDTDNKILQIRCENQGKDNDATYKNNGGKAIDYINKKEAVIDSGPSYVLGPENTNDCPAGSSHVLERDQCQDAYNQLAKTNTGIKNGVEYPGKWDPNARPSGCFLYLTGNTVNFNPDINNEFGAGGDTLKHDQPICRRTVFVLGPKDTNDCPLGSSHVSTRTQCQDAYNQLATTMEGIIDGVKYRGKWDANARPSGCFLYLTGNTVNFNPDINNESGAGGDTLGNDQPICYSYYPRNYGYIIQQKCQQNYPGGNVIATPVSCKVNGCNDYYRSMQPDRSRTMSFSDQCNAGLDGWTCCLDSSPPTTQCAGDYGSNDPCCGQGGGNVDLQFQCPHSKPTCVNYVYDHHWGTCE